MRLPAKYLNLGLLVLGFGLGQGSLFLANTYLFWSHQFELVAAFGAAHALLTFLYFITDWGGMVYLAKEAVMHRPEQRPLVVSYLALSLVRLAVAIVFYAGLLALQIGTPASFATEYSMFAGLGLLVYAFNASGVLDGKSKAGISGLTQAMPVIAAAVALPVSVDLDMTTAGRVLGCAYAVGMMLTIALQLLAAKIDWFTARDALSWRTLFNVGREAMPYMLTPLPGHTLFRLQVLLAVTYLPAQLVALFIYARQIVGVGYQALGFYLRVDLKDFADQLQQRVPSPSEIATRSIAVRLGVLGTVVLAGVACALWLTRPELGIVLLAYAPCLVASALAVTLQRVFLLQSRGGENVMILTISAVTPLVLFGPFVAQTAIWPLIAMELSSQFFQSVLFSARMKINRD